MRLRLNLLSGLLVTAVTGSSVAAQTPPSAIPPVATSSVVTNADSLTLNFVNAEIEGVVRLISEITGRNFLLDPRVKGTVNIVSSRPISKSLVYDVFLSALRLQGYAAVEDRGVIKIVPEADAKLHAGRMVVPGAPSRGSSEEIQTQVFNLRHESAAQLLPILRPLIAPNNSITASAGTNTLVITDYAGNLRRIERIIQAIDQPGGIDAVVIPLHHASAIDVAQSATRLFVDPGGAAADSSQRLAIVADARSNSIVARSENPARLSQLRALVTMLDAPTNVAGNIHVVYLKNAEATRVAETLRAIFNGEGVASGRVASAARSTPQPTVPTPAGGSSPATSPLPQGLPEMARTPGMIQADPATNSVIINAPDAIYNSLRAALDKLDVRRAQVHVEALIVEVSADKAAEFGIQWQSLSGLGRRDVQGFGGTNFGGAGQNIIGASINPATAGRGLNIGVVDGRVNIPGIGEIVNLGVLVRALETDSNTNILSTPTLLTLDNEEARIIIGQNVPFITGQYALTGAATTPTPFQTIERRDVGLTLRVKPQISEGGTVRLQIYQEVSSVDLTTANPAGVTTNKRAVESTVLVDDGQIIVIGGLIQDSVRTGVEKVPFFGDLPLLGALFTYNTRSRSKTNLMVFLRPRLLRDAPSADPLTTDRYDYILGQQRKAAPPESPPLPSMDTPTLPPLEPAGAAVQ